MDKNAQLFDDFLEVVIEVTENDTEVVKLVKKRFERANPEFLQSKDFRQLVRNACKKIQTDWDQKYIYIKDFVTELRAYEKRGKQGLKRKSVFDSEVEKSDCTNGKKLKVGYASDSTQSGRDSPLFTSRRILQCENVLSASPSIAQIKKDLPDGSDNSVLSKPWNLEASGVVDLCLDGDEEDTCRNPAPSNTIKTSGARTIHGKDSPELEVILEEADCKPILNGCKKKEIKKNILHPQTEHPSISRQDSSDMIIVGSDGTDDESDIRWIGNSENESCKVSVGTYMKRETVNQGDSDHKKPGCSAWEKRVSSKEGTNSRKHASGQHHKSKENSKFPDEKNLDEKRRRKQKATERHIRKLEKVLSKLNEKIQKLECAEVSLEEMDKEDSTYLLEEKYKQKCIQVWEKLCELRGRTKSTGRITEQTFKFEGTRYPEINRKIQKFVNKLKIFPDYHDIHEIVAKCNIKYNLQLGKKMISGLARDTFIEVGNQLQSRRMKDFVATFGSRLTEGFSSSNDPAMYDRDLRKKLESNNEEGSSKMRKIFSKYAYKQETGDYDEKDDEGNEDDDVDDKEEEEETKEDKKLPEEEDSDEDQLETDDEDEQEPEDLKEDRQILVNPIPEDEDDDDDDNEESQKDVSSSDDDEIVTQHSSSPFKKSNQCSTKALHVSKRRGICRQTDDNVGSDLEEKVCESTPAKVSPNAGTANFVRSPGNACFLYAKESKMVHKDGIIPTAKSVAVRVTPLPLPDVDKGVTTWIIQGQRLKPSPQKKVYHTKTLTQGNSDAEKEHSGISTIKVSGVCSLATEKERLSVEIVEDENVEEASALPKPIVYMDRDTDGPDDVVDSSCLGQTNCVVSSNSDDVAKGGPADNEEGLQIVEDLRDNGPRSPTSTTISKELSRRGEELWPGSPKTTVKKLSRRGTKAVGIDKSWENISGFASSSEVDLTENPSVSDVDSQQPDSSMCSMESPVPKLSVDPDTLTLSPHCKARAREMILKTALSRSASNSPVTVTSSVPVVNKDSHAFGKGDTYAVENDEVLMSDNGPALAENAQPILITEDMGTEKKRPQTSVDIRSCNSSPIIVASSGPMISGVSSENIIDGIKNVIEGNETSEILTTLQTDTNNFPSILSAVSSSACVGAQIVDLDDCKVTTCTVEVDDVNSPQNSDISTTSDNVSDKNCAETANKSCVVNTPPRRVIPHNSPRRIKVKSPRTSTTKILNFDNIPSSTSPRAVGQESTPYKKLFVDSAVNMADSNQGAHKHPAMSLGVQGNRKHLGDSKGGGDIINVDNILPSSSTKTPSPKSKNTQPKMKSPVGSPRRKSPFHSPCQKSPKSSSSSTASSPDVSTSQKSSPRGLGVVISIDEACDGFPSPPQVSPQKKASLKSPAKSPHKSDGSLSSFLITGTPESAAKNAAVSLPEDVISIDDSCDSVLVVTPSKFGTPRKEQKLSVRAILAGHSTELDQALSAGKEVNVPNEKITDQAMVESTTSGVQLNKLNLGKQYRQVGTIQYVNESCLLPTKKSAIPHQRKQAASVDGKADGTEPVVGIPVDQVNVAAPKIVKPRKPRQKKQPLVHIVGADGSVVVSTGGNAVQKVNPPKRRQKKLPAVIDCDASEGVPTDQTSAVEAKVAKPRKPRQRKRPGLPTASQDDLIAHAVATVMAEMRKKKVNKAKKTQFGVAAKRQAMQMKAAEGQAKGQPLHTLPSHRGRGQNPSTRGWSPTTKGRGRGVRRPSAGLVPSGGTAASSVQAIEPPLSTVGSTSPRGGVGGQSVRRVCGGRSAPFSSGVILPGRMGGMVTIDKTIPVSEGMVVVEKDGLTRSAGGTVPGSTVLAGRARGRGFVRRLPPGKMGIRNTVTSGRGKIAARTSANGHSTGNNPIPVGRRVAETVTSTYTAGQSTSARRGKSVTGARPNDRKLSGDYIVIGDTPPKTLTSHTGIGPVPPVGTDLQAQVKRAGTQSVQVRRNVTQRRPVHGGPVPVGPPIRAGRPVAVFPSKSSLSVSHLGRSLQRGGGSPGKQLVRHNVKGLSSQVRPSNSVLVEDAATCVVGKVTQSDHTLGSPALSTVTVISGGKPDVKRKLFHSRLNRGPFGPKMKKTKINTFGSLAAVERVPASMSQEVGEVCEPESTCGNLSDDQAITSSDQPPELGEPDSVIVLSDSE